MYEIQAAGHTHQGLVRRNNEDSYLLSPDLGLYLVADGMGGHAAGEVASQSCSKSIEAEVREYAPWLEGLASKPTLSREERDKVLGILEEAVSAACLAIYKQAQAHVEQQGMGCTLTCMLVVSNRAFVAHVGDSRLYLLRSAELNVLTKDHRVLEELLRAGRVTPERAKDLSFIDGLSRAVGVQASVQADLLDLEIMDGDRFLLCSDGLHGPVGADGLNTILSSHALQDLPDTLIGSANDAGGPDNVTALLVDVAWASSSERFATADQLADTVGVVPVQDATHANFQSKMAALDNVPMFAHLSYQERVGFLAAADERIYQSGEVLMTEGSTSDDFFILVAGTCQVRKGEADIAELGAGSPIGDMSLVGCKPRSASVVATSTVSALVIGREAFFQFLRADPVVATKLLWSFCQVLTDRLAVTSSELHKLREGHAPTAADMPHLSNEY